MKTYSLKLLPLFIFIFLPLFSQSIFACSCYGFQTPYQAFKESTIVFTGRVVEVLDSAGNKVEDDDKRIRNGDRLQEDRFYRFVVNESFKGEKNQELIIGLSLNMCQFPFRKGDNLLVYASESHGKLWTGTFCSRTKDVNDAQDDIHFLREILQKKPEPRIYGSVRLDNVGYNAPQLKFIEGIKIVAQSGKRKYVTFTDKNGLYRFNKLPNGDYKVFSDLPKKYALSFGLYKEKIKLVSEEVYEHLGYAEYLGKSAYADFRLALNNKVSGKVLDAEGKTVERAEIKLIPLEKINEISDQPKADYIRRSDNFILANQKPGKYILAVEIFAPFLSGKDRLRMYYPQTTDPKEAKVITIGEFGEQSFDVKSPDGYVVREITGSFLWGSGEIIESDGEVSLEKLENSEDKKKCHL